MQRALTSNAGSRTIVPNSDGPKSFGPGTFKPAPFRIQLLLSLPGYSCSVHSQAMRDHGQLYISQMVLGHLDPPFFRIKLLLSLPQVLVPSRAAKDTAAVVAVSFGTHGDE